MVDFYKRLGVSPTASREEIATALVRADPELRRKASSILLNEARRRGYDEAYLAMKRVARFREEVGAGSTVLWNRSVHSEWYDQESHQTSRDIPHPPSIRSGCSGGCSKGCLIWLIVLAILYLIGYYFGN